MFLTHTESQWMYIRFYDIDQFIKCQSENKSRQRNLSELNMRVKSKYVLLYEYVLKCHYVTVWLNFKTRDVTN